MSVIRAPRLLRTCEIDPDEIDLRDRLRPVSEVAVASLVASVEELGIIKDEVLVRETKRQGGTLKLIAGAHRVEACRRLGRKVPAKVYECTDDWARLMEVDDNLAGGELTILDTAMFLAERKRVYERLHPESRRGLAGAAARWSEDMQRNIGSFASTAAEKMGITDRQVRKIVAAGEQIGPHEAGQLRRAPRPVSLSDLRAIAKVVNPSERYFVVDRLAKGEAKSAAAARALYAVQNGLGRPPRSPVEAAFKALREAWSRAPKEARRRFVETELDGIEDLYFEIRDGVPGEGEE